MAWNGSGTFSRTNGVYSGSSVWTNDKDAGVKIRSDRHDTHDQDLAAGINAALAKNGENTPTANLPMGSYKHTGVATASGNSSRSEYVSGATAQDGAFLSGGETGGTSTAYTASLTPAIAAYADKQKFTVRFDQACGANPTINFNSVGAKKMYINVAGTATQVTTGGIVADQVSDLVYDAALDTATGAFWMTAALPGWVTAAGRALLDDAAASDQRTTLGLGTAAVVDTGVSTGDVPLAENVIGKQTVWIPASAMIARTTTGAATASVESSTNKVMTPVLDFDASTDEFAQFLINMPKSWDEGTVTAVFCWTAASGSGDVIWGLQGVALSNDDAIDTAYGTAQVVTDTLITAADVHFTSETSAITIAGTPAAEDLVSFQVYRDANAAGDTIAADARLIGVRLYYTTNTGVDS